MQSATGSLCPWHACWPLAPVYGLCVYVWVHPSFPQACSPAFCMELNCPRGSARDPISSGELCTHTHRRHCQFSLPPWFCKGQSQVNAADRPVHARHMPAREPLIVCSGCVVTKKVKEQALLVGKHAWHQPSVLSAVHVACPCCFRFIWLSMPMRLSQPRLSMRATPPSCITGQAWCPQCGPPCHTPLGSRQPP